MSNTHFYPLKISRITQETEQAICISFEISKDLDEAFNFKPGQYLTLESEIEGVKVRRSYSICSAINEEVIKVGIKRVKNGVFSNYANDEFKVGDVIQVMPPQGAFYPNIDSSHQKNYMCLAVGSGITPILSIIKSILKFEPESSITLIYGNKRKQTMMFKEDLLFVKNQYLTRFNWINVMSQEDQGSDVLKGKINNKIGALLQKYKLIDIEKMNDAFICGPESMISEVSRGFRQSGMKASNIHFELFANSSEDAKEILKKTEGRIKNYGEDKTSNVTVIADGRTIDFELAIVGENILDAGMNNGMELPYACKAGVCSTCKAKLITGEVEMDIRHGLEDQEVEEGYILTCQSHPISQSVVVSFDDR